jgi:hypothetical protein
MRRGGLGFCSRCGEGERALPAACHLRAAASPRLDAEVGLASSKEVTCGWGAWGFVVIAARENAAPLPHLTSAPPQDHASALRQAGQWPRRQDTVAGDSVSLKMRSARGRPLLPHIISVPPP